MLYPAPLKQGDNVLLLSPAGSIDAEIVEKASEVLNRWGLKVTIAEHCLGAYGRFSGSKAQRFSDLQTAFDRSDIKAIFCTRGGYGVMQYVDHLNCELLKQHPKWIIGYSDITALHGRLFHEGLISLHAPMLKHLAVHNGEDEVSQLLHKTLFNNIPPYQLPFHPLNRMGTGIGPIYGGNLALLQAMRGTPYDIPDNSLLFIEDIGEHPYRVDRMIQNLRLSGVLERISGLIVGQFTDYDEDPYMMQTVYEGIAEAVAPFHYPVCFNFPVGHVDQNYPLLHGTKATLLINDGAAILLQTTLQNNYFK